MIKKIVLTIIDVISVAVIATAVLLLLMVFLTKPGQPPKIFGYYAFRVVTGSMEPTIPKDSLLLIQNSDAAQVKVDDIITFYSTDPSLNGAINTHRVVSIDDSGDALEFYTKGDANALADVYTVQESNLIGVVVFCSHTLGVLARLVSNPLFAFVIIAIPLMVIFITGIRRTIKIAKQMELEEDERIVMTALEKHRQSAQTPENPPPNSDKDQTT